MEPFEYLRLQMKLEGLSLNQNGFIAALNPDDGDMPLVILAQAANGVTVAYYGEILPFELGQELAACNPTIQFPNVDAVVRSLRAHGLQPEVGHYKTYIFPEAYTQASTGPVKCFSKHDPQIKAFGLGFDSFADTIYAIEDAGVIVSACVSVRQNPDCAEAWVATLPEYRQRGLAQRGVAAWAKSMMQQGIIPLYSHEMTNVASSQLANKLGLIPVYEEISLSDKKA